MTRQEAINEIKSWDFLEGKEIEAIQTLIPELKESEEERIRKSILHKMKACQKQSNFFRKEEIDYLEKQKENIEKEYVFRPLAGTDITIAAEQAIERANEGDRLVLAFNGAYIPVRKGCDANKIVDIYDAFIEKQKEPENTSATTMIPSCWEVEQKEQKEIPLMNGDTDLYFDEWNQQHSNPTKRECFEAGMLYAVRLLTEDSPMLEEFKKGLEQVILWAKEGYKVSPDGTTKTLTQDEIDGVLDEQKEQKHPDGCFTCDEYKKGYEEGRRNGFTAGYNKAMKEVEQKEQKPTEKQDYSGLSNLERVIHRGFLAADLEDVPVTIIKETAKECVAQMKPAEWDDYTKINLGRAIQIIKDARGTLHGYQTDDGIYECDKAIEALEHFLYRGLEIEKSAEWSEEDEEMLNSCISSIEEAKENRYAYKETDGDTSYDHEIDWLKSLRPSWKPSKEQMESLRDTIINTKGYSYSVYLPELYEQLKKLR